jgi:hypothetical protein
MMARNHQSQASSQANAALQQAPALPSGKLTYDHIENDLENDQLMDHLPIIDGDVPLLC